MDLDVLEQAKIYCDLDGHEEEKNIFFQKLLARWREQTSGYSLLGRFFENETYQAIVALGPQAIPWLLRELQDRPGHWARALHLITGENPIREEHRGRLHLISEDWFAWARERGISW